MRMCGVSILQVASQSVCVCTYVCGYLAEAGAAQECG
jgi:hypothetical protein